MRPVEFIVKLMVPLVAVVLLCILVGSCATSLMGKDDEAERAEKIAAQERKVFASMDGRFELVDSFSAVSSGDVEAYVLEDVTTGNVYICEYSQLNSHLQSSMTLMWDGDVPMTKKRYFETKSELRDKSTTRD